MPMFTPHNTKGFAPARLAQMNTDYNRGIVRSETPDDADECSLVAERVWRACEIARFVH